MNPEPQSPLDQDTAHAPVWLVAVFALLLYGGFIYLDHYSGGFNPQVYAPYRNYDELAAAQPSKDVDPLFEKGAKLFSLTCAPCHQATGLGAPGQFPPLAGSDWVLEKDPSRIIRLPLLGAAGPITVNGVEWNPPSAMPSFASVLTTDEDLAAVLTYIRQSWGNKAPAVTIEQVKKVKAELGARKEPTSAAELLKIPLAP